MIGQDALVPGRRVFGTIALLSVGAVAVALYTQHRLDMQPCPWCVLQRLVFVAIGTLAVIGLVLPSRGLRLGLAATTSALALAGIAAALWQHFVAAASASCNLTLADRIMSATGLDRLLPEVFAPYASCADARVDLLGVPYEFYSLALFAAIDLAATLLVVRLARPAGHAGRRTR